LITLPERLRSENEVFRKMMDALSSRIRVASPGIIQSFNANKQTVEVRIAIQEKITINGEVSDITIPKLVDVPIFMPRAGGFALTLPVQAGDECLVIFSDCCYDAWYQSGDIQKQIDHRRHDLSDGFALLGIWSQPHVISDYDTSSAFLRNEAGSVKVKVSANEIDLIATTVKINGKDYMQHAHLGVTVGSGTTGGVSPV